MRILVQVLHVRVRGGAVEVEIVFLNVLAMIAFAICQAKQTFFQDGIPAIPERNCETKLLLVIADPGKTVFSPTIGA